MDDSSDVQQLDFYQAMADFRHMFPTMDEEVIEAVLRANNGAVDATIDQLLSLTSSEARGTKSTSKSSGLSEPIARGSTPVLGMVSRAASHWPVPPPNNDHSSNTLTPCTPSTNSFSSLLIDAPIDEFIQMGAECPQPESDLVTPVCRIPQHTPSAPRISHRGKSKSVPEKQLPFHNPVNANLFTSKWQPPLLGELPRDFLRLEMPSSTSCHSVDRSAHHHRTHHRHSHSHRPATIQEHRNPVSLQGSGNQPGPISQPGSRKSMEVGGVRPKETRHQEHQHKPKQAAIPEAAKAPINPYHRPVTAQEQAQIQEDEYLARMLQNQEFLEEISQDKALIEELQRDKLDTSFIVQSSEDPQFDVIRPREDLLEGYGPDMHKSLGAFPYDKQVHQSVQNLGPTSKNRLKSAAKRFFSRKKKSPTFNNGVAGDNLSPVTYPMNQLNPPATPKHRGGCLPMPSVHDG